MGSWNDIRMLYQLLVRPIRGKTHAERIEHFYGLQAEGYDDFRRRLLLGREELFRSIVFPKGGRWVDLGGATGWNFECLDEQIAHLEQVTIVDLSPSLLAVADRRIQEKGWDRVRTVEANATDYRPTGGPVDVVTFSYSLSMIPDWFTAIDNALAMLRPGGTIGVVDFYVSRKPPAAGQTRHGPFQRAFWPVWFTADNVHLSWDHLPYLQRVCEPVELVESWSPVPYLPFLKTPYYRFLGRKHRL